MLIIFSPHAFLPLLPTPFLRCEPYAAFFSPLLLMIYAVCCHCRADATPPEDAFAADTPFSPRALAFAMPP